MHHLAEISLNSLFCIEKAGNYPGLSFNHLVRLDIVKRVFFRLTAC
ncbi:hypothetical protein [Salmonella phage NINP13076]|nr:hypothetical protein [Salmonella phage NINP13076]